MATVIQTDLPTIMQAVEQQLLNYESPITNATVVGDISNIYWALAGRDGENGDDPPPGQTGQRDVILVERHDDTVGNVQGAGRNSWIYSGIDVNLRSSFVVDPRSTRRAFMIAHRNLINGLLDALMGFFPEDDEQNALTIQGFVLDINAAPVKNRDTKTWGETVGTYRFHYRPMVDISRLA